MKKIISLICLLSFIFVINYGSLLNAADDNSAFDPFKENFPVVNDNNVKKIGSTVGSSSTITLTSNANKDLGTFGVDFEYYLIDNDVQYDYIIVLYRITLNPYDKVKYKNGLGGWFTETGDAFVNNASFESSKLNGINTRLSDYGPKAEPIQYTESFSISLVPITVANQSGYDSIVYVPSFTYTLTAQTQSVRVNDSTNNDDGIVKTSFVFKNDSYSKGTSYQYGFYFVEIPQHQKQINLKDKVTVKMSVGGSWGVSSDTATVTQNKQLSWL